MEAVLLTGLFGVGKSTTIAAEMADLLEDAGLSYAALDLDWLTWCNVGDGDRAREHAMMLRNLGAVVANYRAAGALLRACSMDTRPQRAGRPGRHDGDATAHG
jgi:adenylylsulfate kinase-like enzyme